MPHYRTMLSNDNFSAADLWSEQGQRYGAINVAIVSIKKGEVVGEGGRKKGMPFATLKSMRTGQIIPKPLGMNATNCRKMSSLAGSENTDKWRDIPIELVVVDTTVGRESVKAIRIAGLAPDQQPADTKAGAASSQPADKIGAPSAPLPDATELSEADKRAIDMAEANEARRNA